MNSATAPQPPASAQDQKLSPEDVARARQFLQQTQTIVIGATKSVSGAQWKFKTSPDRWSIAEILDHIVIVQERVLDRILDQLPSAPAPSADFDPQTVDAIVIHQFPTRLARFSAPEILAPKETDPQGRLDRLVKNYARMDECLSTAVGLRQHVLDSPPLKAVSGGKYTQMDGYQWILVAAAHAERHAKQMLEVKADSNYPA